MKSTLRVVEVGCLQGGLTRIDAFIAWEGQIKCLKHPIAYRSYVLWLASWFEAIQEIRNFKDGIHHLDATAKNSRAVTVTRRCLDVMLSSIKLTITA